VKWKCRGSETPRRDVGFEPTTLRSLARLLQVDQPDALGKLLLGLRSLSRLSYRGTKVGADLHPN